MKNFDLSVDFLQCPDPSEGHCTSDPGEHDEHSRYYKESNILKYPEKAPHLNYYQHETAKQNGIKNKITYTCVNSKQTVNKKNL